MQNRTPKPWERLPEKPDWADEVGPWPDYCLFCSARIVGRFLAGVFTPQGTELEDRVKGVIGLMLSVCEECLERYGEESLTERIERELERRTRVN